MQTNKRSDYLKYICQYYQLNDIQPCVYRNQYIRNLNNEFTLYFPKDNLLIVISRYTWKKETYKLFSFNQLLLILTNYNFSLCGKNKNLDLSKWIYIKNHDSITPTKKMNINYIYNE